MIAIIISLAAIAAKSNSNIPPREQYHDSDVGIGMTFDGKVGVDMGGVVIPFDGSNPSGGFGF